MAIAISIFMTVSTFIVLLVCRIAGKMSQIEAEQERRYIRRRGLDPAVVLDDSEELAALDKSDPSAADRMRPLTH